MDPETPDLDLSEDVETDDSMEEMEEVSPSPVSRVLPQLLSPAHVCV